jgi:hypothetical protein
MILLNDRISVPTSRKLTDAGQMHVPCAFARTGSQLYTAGQLGLQDRDAKEIVTVWRDEADVFAQDSLESFRSAPVTIGHPKDADGKSIAVSADNSKELQVGMLEGMPVRDEDTLGGTLILTAKEAIDALEDGTQELSAGYLCDIEEVEGKLFQRNIRANHIAIVAKGRAGSSCRISDEAIDLADESTLTEAGVEVEVAKTFTADEFDAQVALVTDAEEKLALADAKIVKLEEDAKVKAAALADAEEKLASAVLAASEGVVERCKAIENARLVADMRDVADKSVSEIHRMVIEDQMPTRDLEGKSDDYVAAIFEMLVDAAKGETPMGKLMAKEASDIIVDQKPQISLAEKKRAAMIARNSK